MEVMKVEVIVWYLHNLPLKAQALVKEWLDQHDKELQNMWNTQQIGKLPPLV